MITAEDLLDAEFAFGVMGTDNPLPEDAERQALAIADFMIRGSLDHLSFAPTAASVPYGIMVGLFAAQKFYERKADD